MCLFCSAEKSRDDEESHRSLFHVVAVLLCVSILGVVLFATCAVCTTKNGNRKKKGGRIAAAAAPEGTWPMLLGHGHSSTVVPHTKSSATQSTEPFAEDIEKFVVLRGIPGMELARGELAQLWKRTELELRLHITTASMRLDDLTWILGQWKMKIKDQELLQFELEKQQKSREATDEGTSQSHNKCDEKGTFCMLPIRCACSPLDRPTATRFH